MSRVSRYLFVYGTLKAGFPNQHVNRGVRVPGQFVTCERFPLYIIGRHDLPWMVNAPGQGEHVVGELYEVDDADVAEMDVLERIDEPGWYQRITIQVLACGDAASTPQTCEVYLGGPERCEVEGVRVGPLSEFTLAHAKHYVRTHDHPEVVAGSDGNVRRRR